MKVKPEKCEVCLTPFSQVEYHAKNKCQPCYSKERQKLRRPKSQKVKQKDFTHCQNCNAEYGTYNDKGRKIQQQAHGMCRTCYQRFYHNKEGRVCKTCNRPLQATVRDICKLCHMAEKEKKWQENSYKRPDSYRHKLKVSKTQLEYSQYELIRRLLGKFKMNYFSQSDYFRVIDIYIDIYDYETHLDAYSPDDQIVIMLSRLKEVWLYNKELKELALEKIRKKAEKRRKINI